jgi:non-ribosomal peptide synthetase component F
VTLEETGDALQVHWNYNAELFAAPTINRWATHFATLLASIVAQPEQRIARLPLLPAEERQQLLVEWNETGRAYPAGGGLHELVAAQAARTPQGVALITAESQLSYGELNGRANQLARYLQRLGVGPEARVGVLMARSAELVVGLLGIMKAGGAYVPLDPQYPVERLAFMLKDAAVQVLLTEEKLRTVLPDSPAYVVTMEDATQVCQREADTNPSSRISPANLAYVIYTSGSTGQPKGVAITHQSAATLVHWAQETFTAAELSGVLAATSLSFDLSVFELFVPLSSGGAVILAENVLQLPTLVCA